MKKAKIVKLEKSDQQSKVKDIEESYSVKKFIFIILVLVLVFATFYFITTLVVKSEKLETTSNNIVPQIDTSKILISQLLDRSQEEYYVLAIKPSLYDNYTSRANYTEIYNKYIKDYSSKENSLKFYKVDLDDALNKNYLDKEINITNDLSKIKINDEVLFKINRGKIEDYYVGSDSIIKALSEIK